MDSAPPAVVDRLLALVDAPAEADVLLAAWLRRFGGVADRVLRRTVLTDLLAETDDGSLLGLLLRIEARAAQGDAACRALATELALTPSALHALPYERQAELYGASRAAGYDRLALRFLGGPPPAARLPAKNPYLERSPGERRSAARGRDRLLLDRLLHDRDPRVVGTLLDNPRITEADVVRIAAMRPTEPEILARIAAHPRWGQRYHIRKALSFNPSSPPTLARSLLPTLLRQDLVAFAETQLLSASLREEVRALLDDAKP